MGTQTAESPLQVADIGTQTLESVSECQKRHMCSNDTIGGGEFAIKALEDIRDAVRSGMNIFNKLDYIHKVIDQFVDDRYAADPKGKKRVTYVTVC